MELVLIDPSSLEWQYMWEWLEKHPINEGLENPSSAINNYEAWQYMGSFKQNDKLIHEFRHKNHPLTNSLQALKVSASSGFTPDQISKKYKL